MPEAQFEPGGVEAEAAGGEAAEAGGLAAPDVVLDGGMPAVADLQLSAYRWTCATSYGGMCSVFGAGVGWGP